MRWYEATLYEAVEVGTDATHNPVRELRRTDRMVLVRTAPRTASHDANEGNMFDLEERTLLTRADPEAIRGAAACEVCGTLYDITGVSSREALVALRVRRCKGDGLPHC